MQAFGLRGHTVCNARRASRMLEARPHSESGHQTRPAPKSIAFSDSVTTRPLSDERQAVDVTG